MRIAMLAPPYFRVPPDGYGGIETIVGELVDALVERGHTITLIGAGGHGTRAQHFLSTFDTPLAAQLGDPMPELVHAARAHAALANCDVQLVHDHTLAGPLLAQDRAVPTIATVHGCLSGMTREYYRSLIGRIALVGISDAQRGAAPELPWLGTVHNAIRVSSYSLRREKDDYVVFLGRFHPEKAPHLAIDAARKAGVPIRLAGKCAERVERNYFDNEIKPRLGPDIEVVGVADGFAKRELLSHARCLVFPICWDEPFGLVLVEAMACGTPVVALRRGAVEEVVVDGQTGIIVDSAEQIPDAIAAAARLDPQECRAHAERRFDIPVMADGYEALYRDVLSKPRWFFPESPEREAAGELG
jgi:glycosyltransferase involved in cell wall biosynthesis